MNRQTLLTGVLHSLHTAECRLREAHLLYEHDLYSGAVILALFGQEEFGRAVLLHGLASTLAIDASLPPGQLDALSDHVTRLGAGRCGTFLRAPARINAEIQAALASGSQDALEAARAPLDDLHRRKANRQPDDLQQLRESGQYTDFHNGRWNSPWALTQVRCHEILGEACAHFLNHWFRLIDDPELMHIWQSLPESDRPRFPPLVLVPSAPHS